ncbi:hypothetical protein ACIBG8_28225 [Nonomuraea sp. NPDC050556]|uniref:hypothetical protein n=1 Tax=Nonomuraea sp. NPDC050556 TaxID=3364369 RepID=UPI0037886E1D
MNFKKFSAWTASAALTATVLLASATPAHAGSYTCWLDGNPTCTTQKVAPYNGSVVAKISGNVTGRVWDTINQVYVGSEHSCSASTTCSWTVGGLTHTYVVKVKARWNNIWNNGWGSIADR